MYIPMDADYFYVCGYFCAIIVWELSEKHVRDVLNTIKKNH